MDRLASCNSCEVYEKEEYLESVTVKEEPASEDDVPTDIPLDCMLCAKKLLTVSGLKAHVIAQHNYKSVKRKSGDCPSPDNSAAKQQKHECNVCSRSFVTSTDLKVHETCHDKFCCFACNAKFDSFKGVTRHRRRCKNKDVGAATKPKTLADILRERKAQKNAAKLVKDTKQLRVHCLRCTDTCFHDMTGYKIHKVLKHGEVDGFDESKKRIEIEITNVVSTAQDQGGSVKTSLNVNKESDEVVNNTKEQVDYAKIETELESIFDVAVEKRQLQVTILENETDTSPNIEDKEEDDAKHKTVEEILSQESKTDDPDRPQIKIEQQEYRNENEEDCNEKNKQSSNSFATPVETNTQCLIESESSLLNKVKSETSCNQNIEVDAFNLKCDLNNELDKLEMLNMIDTIQSTEAIKELFDIKVDEYNINKKSEQKESVDIKPIENSKQSNEEAGEQYKNESKCRNTIEDQTQNKTDEEIKEPNKENKTNSSITIDEVQNQESVTNCKETKVEGQVQDNQDETNGTRPVENTTNSQDETTSMETCYQPEEKDKRNEEKDTKLNDDIFEEVDKNETDATKTNNIEIKDKENEKPDFNVDSDIRIENIVNIQDDVDIINTAAVEQNALVKTLNDCVQENEESKHSDILSKIV